MAETGRRCGAVDASADLRVCVCVCVWLQQHSGPDVPPPFLVTRCPTGFRTEKRAAAWAPPPRSAQFPVQFPVRPAAGRMKGNGLGPSRWASALSAGCIETGLVLNLQIKAGPPTPGWSGGSVGCSLRLSEPTTRTRASRCRTDPVPGTWPCVRSSVHRSLRTLTRLVKMSLLAVRLQTWRNLSG